VSAEPALHPDLEPLAFLIGTWRGLGSGSYPGSRSFDYEEELSFSHEGKPVLASVMRTWRADNGAPSHGERGFWKCKHGTQVDTVIAHATGHAEVGQGFVEARCVEVSSSSIVAWRGSKEVLAIKRRIALRGDVLVERLDMKAVGQDLQGHVAAELRRV
jgi:hypothetical protein